MRRLIAAAGLLAVSASCANLGAPPGGPPRTTPPVLLSVVPESGAVNVRAKGIVFTFDEVVTNNDPERYFLLSPEDGQTRVNWHRSRIEVRPRHGFRANTAYSVTLLPGLTDLRNNALKTGRTIIFSTGPEIPRYLVLGRVFDWQSERPAAKAQVAVIRRPDSLPYVGVADSAGQFGVGPLGPAQYTVVAYMDNNGNRTLDRGEPWDSLDITVAGGASPFVELLAITRDTIAPRLMTITTPDTTTIVAGFDRPLSPDLAISPSRFRIVAADSTPLRIISAMTRAQADSLERVRRDSVARDSTGRADSTRAGAAPRDTATLHRGGPVVAPPPRPSRPAPPREVTLKLDSLTPLHPAHAYRLTAIDVLGLLGGTRTTDRVFNVPRPKVDSTRVRPDSTRLPAKPARPPGKP